MHELQLATSQDQHLQCLKDYIIQGWTERKEQIPQDIRTYWTFRGYMTVINGVIIKGRHLVVPEVLQKPALQQLHVNHMGIEKPKLLVCSSIYWIGMTADFEQKNNSS